MKRLPVVLMLVFLVGMIADPLEAIGQSTNTAEDKCKKALRADKWLEQYKNQTLCYRAVLEGSSYARKMLHRSSFLVEPALRLYLDVAIAASTPDLDLGSMEHKRLQRQQVRFWKKTKNSDLDLLFLEDNSGFPYRFLKVTQKEDRAEIIVHFQRGLNTDTQSTPSTASGGRYMLSRPNKTWLIDDFESVDVELDINQIGIWLSDYVNYARSAYGNDIDSNFIALASEAGLSHFWLSGEPGHDADFLRRNHGRGLGGVPPAIPSPSADIDPGVFIDLGFFKDEPSASDSSLEDDPDERARYQVVRRNARWFIASFKEIEAAEPDVVQDTSEDVQPTLDPEKFISDTLRYIENLVSCAPSTYTYTHPMIPGFTGKSVVKGDDQDRCLIQIHMPGDLIMECAASARHIELLRNQTALMLKELQEIGAYEFSIEIDLGSGVSSSELSNLMGEECQW